MYFTFREYIATKERRKKMTEVRSARYICAGEISSEDTSEGSQGSHFLRPESRNSGMPKNSYHRVTKRSHHNGFPLCMLFSYYVFTILLII